MQDALASRAMSCSECGQRVTLDFIDRGGINRWQHYDGTPACPDGAADAWRALVALLCGWAAAQQPPPALLRASDEDVSAPTYRSGMGHLA